MDLDEKSKALNALKFAISDCKKCGLCNGRNHVVLGEGNPDSKLMFIGEGPGADEDATGRPFVGRAGQLLTKMINAIDLKREDVYIANIVKCRPPQNRNPLEKESNACLPYLRKQVAIIRPKIIVCLGAVAARQIIDPNISIMKQRGQWFEKCGVLLMPTYHPSALLRFPERKADAWEDFKKIRIAYKKYECYINKLNQ